MLISFFTIIFFVDLINYKKAYVSSNEERNKNPYLNFTRIPLFFQIYNLTKGYVVFREIERYFEFRAIRIKPYIDSKDPVLSYTSIEIVPIGKCTDFFEFGNFTDSNIRLKSKKNIEKKRNIKKINLNIEKYESYDVNENKNKTKFMKQEISEGDNFDDTSKKYEYNLLFKPGEIIDKMCLDPYYLVELYGVIGDVKNQSILQIDVMKCKNSTENSNCYPSDKLEKEIAFSFFSLRYLDYFIDNNQIYSPGEAYLKGDIFTMGPQIKRNINYLVKNIDYNTDFGWMGSDMRLQNYHKMSDPQSSTDLFFHTNSSYLQIIISLDPIKVNVYRSFEKLQNVLASLSAISTLTICCLRIISGMFAEILYYGKMIQLLGLLNVIQLDSNFYEGFKNNIFGKRISIGKNMYDINSLFGNNNGSSTNMSISQLERNKQKIVENNIKFQFANRGSNNSVNTRNRNKRMSNEDKNENINNNSNIELLNLKATDNDANQMHEFMKKISKNEDKNHLNYFKLSQKMENKKEGKDNKSELSNFPILGFKENNNGYTINNQIRRKSWFNVNNRILEKLYVSSDTSTPKNNISTNFKFNLERLNNNKNIQNNTDVENNNNDKNFEGLNNNINVSLFEDNGNKTKNLNINCPKNESLNNKIMVKHQNLSVFDKNEKNKMKNSNRFFQTFRNDKKQFEKQENKYESEEMKNNLILPLDFRNKIDKINGNNYNFYEKGIKNENLINKINFYDINKIICKRVFNKNSIESKLYMKSESYLKKKLSLEEIIKKLYEIDKIKFILFNEDLLNIFSSIPNPNFIKQENILTENHEGKFPNIFNTSIKIRNMKYPNGNNIVEKPEQFGDTSKHERGINDINKNCLLTHNKILDNDENRQITTSTGILIFDLWNKFEFFKAKDHSLKRSIYNSITDEKQSSKAKNLLNLIKV